MTAIIALCLSRGVTSISLRLFSIYFNGIYLKVRASTVEDDREDPFSLLEDSDVKEAALVVDSDDETDDLLDI